MRVSIFPGFHRRYWPCMQLLCELLSMVFDGIFWELCKDCDAGNVHVHSDL